MQIEAGLSKRIGHRTQSDDKSGKRPWLNESHPYVTQGRIETRKSPLSPPHLPRSISSSLYLLQGKQGLPPVFKVWSRPQRQIASGFFDRIDHISAHMVGVSYFPCRFRSMPIAWIKVTAVSDAGDNVVVWGRTEYVPKDSDPVGFAFQTKGEHADIGLAERASKLASGTEAVIEYVSIAKDWNLASGLSVS